MDYLLKKDTFRVLLPYQTEVPTEERHRVKEGYGLTCVEILLANMDGKGSALIKTMDVEIIRYKDDSSRDLIIKNEQYSIERYTELENMLLSKDWILSDTLIYGKIEKIIKRTQKVIKK